MQVYTSSIASFCFVHGNSSLKHITKNKSCLPLPIASILSSIISFTLKSFSSCSGKGQGYWDEENIREEMPACRQMLNIFHPFDPVAYRFSLVSIVSCFSFRV